MGVWIETYGLRNAIDYGTVTPYVGVWIETFMSLSSSGVGMSHPCLLYTSPSTKIPLILIFFV